MYRILAFSSLTLCLLLAYFLWRSYKYNRELTEKYNRLLVGDTSEPCKQLQSAEVPPATVEEPPQPEAPPATVEELQQPEVPPATVEELQQPEAPPVAEPTAQ